MSPLGQVVASRVSSRSGGDVTSRVAPARQVVTQWAFCGYALIRDGPETGLLLRPGYREGLAHFWRCIGYRLGIPDRSVELVG